MCFLLLDEFNLYSDINKIFSLWIPANENMYVWKNNLRKTSGDLGEVIVKYTRHPWDLEYKLPYFFTLSMVFGIFVISN